MKDTAHHLKKVQKKVIQSARKESYVRFKSPNGHTNNIDYLAVGNAKAVPK